MKKFLFVGLFVFFSTAVFAHNIENRGKRNIAKPVISNVEGSVHNMNVNIQRSTKVSSISLDLPKGPSFKKSIPPINAADLPNPDDISSANPSSILYEQQDEERALRESRTSPWEKDVKWANDILIWGGTVGSGQDFDVDESTGDIYAIFDTNHSTYDSLIVFRSTDGGNTWSFWRASYTSTGTVSKPKVRVAKDASGVTWVCMAGIFNSGTSSEYKKLYVRRMKTDQSVNYWETVSDSVDYFDMDADVGTGAYVYVTYIPSGSGNDVWAARNHLDGNGWVNNQSLFVDPLTFPYPQIAAGAGGNVSIAFIDNRITTNDEIRIKRSTNYGSTWLGSAQVSNNSGAATLLFTDIAYSHGATQTGWIFVTFRFPSSDNLVYYYSTDSGVNWTYGTVIGGGGDENMSTIRARKATGALTVAYNADPGDSTMFTWASVGSPTSFTTPVRINDYNATGIWPPTAGWNGHAYSAVIYSSHTQNYKPYFDWFGNTGIEDNDEVTTRFLTAPGISNGNATINYVVKTRGNVRISLYDMTGRLFDILVDEAKPVGKYSLNISKNLASGIYFIRMNSADGVYTTRMTVFK